MTRKFIATVGEKTVEKGTMEEAVNWSLAEVRTQMMTGVQIHEFTLVEHREFGWTVNYPLAETPNP